MDPIGDRSDVYYVGTLSSIWVCPLRSLCLPLPPLPLLPSPPGLMAGGPGPPGGGGGGPHDAGVPAPGCSILEYVPL